MGIYTVDKKIKNFLAKKSHRFQLILGDKINHGEIQKYLIIFNYNKKDIRNSPMSF